MIWRDAHLLTFDILLFYKYEESSKRRLRWSKMISKGTDGHIIQTTNSPPDL